MAERVRSAARRWPGLSAGRPTSRWESSPRHCFVLGMNTRFAELADASHDRVGMDLQAETLPKRIYGPRGRHES